MPKTLVQAGLSNDANLQGYWTFDQTEDTNTKLLLHFNGADAATSTIESSSGKTVTFVGNAQLDTAQTKFGSSSLLLDGTGDYVSLADSADWSFGTGDFTVDAWVRFNTTGNFRTLCGQWESNTKQWRILFGSSSTVLYVDNTTTTIAIANSWTPSTGQWYHFALTRSGNTFRMFVDGTQIGTDQTDADTIPDFAGSLYIGTDFNGGSGSSNNFNGWIDELRIVKGTAKWTANFTPPTSPYSFQTDDLSKNGYHLITGTQPTNVTGLFNKAGDFESSSSNYITLANASTPNLNITGTISFGCFVNVESFPTSGNVMYPLSKGYNGTSTAYQVQIFNNSGTLQLTVGSFQTSTHGVTWNISGWSTGVWVHIAGVYTGSKWILYFNGVNLGESTDATGAISNLMRFGIGYLDSGGTPGNYFDGLMDEAFVFNRALTDSEVGRIYTSFVPKVIII